MQRLWSIALLAAVLFAPAAASARSVELAVQLKRYGGDGAYVAVYLTDAQGVHQRTLWVAGPKAKYRKHLRDWYRAGGSREPLDGISGASVGAGTTLRVTVEVADTLIDAGFDIHVDTAVEDMKENPSEVVAPLTSAGSGKPFAGRGYVKTFTYTL